MSATADAAGQNTRAHIAIPGVTALYGYGRCDLKIKAKRTVIENDQIKNS
jgi:hypothetical protein